MNPQSTSSEGAGSNLQTELKQHSAKKGMVFNILLTLFEAGGAIVLFKIASSHGATPVNAYLIGSIAPVLGGIFVWIRSKKFSGASAAIFLFTAVSAVLAVVGSTDPKILLYKDAVSSALIGLIVAASALTRRPLMFYFAQRYGNDGSRRGMDLFDEMWRIYPNFRSSMYRINALWAVIFLIEAGLKALVIANSKFSSAYIWDQIFPIAAIVVGMALTIRIVKRMRRREPASA